MRSFHYGTHDNTIFLEKLETFVNNTYSFISFSFSQIDGKRKKSFPIQGVYFAPVTDNLFDQGNPLIPSEPLIFVSNFIYGDLTLRTGFVIKKVYSFLYHICPIYSRNSSVKYGVIL